MANDRDVDRVSELCYRFDMTSDDGGTISSKDHDRIERKFLTVDYSKDPPIAVFKKTADKFATWKVHQSPDGVASLENVNDRGKKAWLFMDDQPALLVPLNGGQMVSEFRRAVISTDKKTLVKIKKGYDDDSK